MILPIIHINVVTGGSMKKESMLKKLLNKAGEMANKSNSGSRCAYLLFKKGSFDFKIERGFDTETKPESEDDISVWVGWKRWEKTFNFDSSSAKGNVKSSRKELKRILKTLCEEAEARGLERDPMLGYDRATLIKKGIIKA